MRTTRRVRISTGLMCNIRCPFCYYNEELNNQQYAVDEIIKMLDTAWRLGIRDIDFSGGEPTFRKDFPGLVRYAKEKGFERICVITNGTRIANKAYLSELMEAGLNEVLLSVHSDSEEMSVKLSERNGIQEKVIRALDNITELGIRLRTNTVVNQENKDHLLNIVKQIRQYPVVAVNFICFNDWVNASSVTDKMAVRYSEVADNIKEAIDYLASSVPKITVRYIPYCFMQGYEKYVCNLQQNLYDNDEWIDSVKRIVTDIDDALKLRLYQKKLNEALEESRVEIESLLGRYGLDLENIKDRTYRFDELAASNVVMAHVVENHHLRQTYRKKDVCKSCSREKICDGLHKSYGDCLGADELSPIKGEIIDNPMYFRAAYTSSWT